MAADPEAQLAGPLDGVRIIELGLMLAGSFAGWLETILGRQLEGMVYRAGVFAPIAG